MGGSTATCFNLLGLFLVGVVIDVELVDIVTVSRTSCEEEGFFSIDGLVGVAIEHSLLYISQRMMPAGCFFCSVAGVVATCRIKTV